MRQHAVSVAEAKRSLSELLSRVADRGEAIVIAKRGKPMARLVPIASSRRESLADVRGWLNDTDPFFAALRWRTSSGTGTPVARAPVDRPGVGDSRCPC